MPQTDAIFANIAVARQRAASDDNCLRISIDTKAKVKIGPFSRGGQARMLIQAADHDMHPDALLVPFGILEVARGSTPINQLNILFGQSCETADFIVDALQTWWASRGGQHAGLRRLTIEQDNGPEISSSRTQFLKRLVEFADATRLEIELAYFPPYHSKYNPIERCWGILEQHWNGAILDSIEAALQWARTMTWRGLSPFVHYLPTTYQRGVKLTRQALKPTLQRLKRHIDLPKWSLNIQPQTA